MKWWKRCITSSTFRTFCVCSSRKYFSFFLPIKTFLWFCETHYSSSRNATCLSYLRLCIYLLACCCHSHVMLHFLFYSIYEQVIRHEIQKKEEICEVERQNWMHTVSFPLYFSQWKGFDKKLEYKVSGWVVCGVSRT